MQGEDANEPDARVMTIKERSRPDSNKDMNWSSPFYIEYVQVTPEASEERGNIARRSRFRM